MKEETWDQQRMWSLPKPLQMPKFDIFLRKLYPCMTRIYNIELQKRTNLTYHEQKREIYIGIKNTSYVVHDYRVITKTKDCLASMVINHNKYTCYNLNEIITAQNRISRRMKVSLQQEQCMPWPSNRHITCSLFVLRF